MLSGFIRVKVTRAFISMGLALLLLSAVMGEACLGCSPSPAPMKGDCCKGHGRCPAQASTKAHSECGAATSDPFTVEKVTVAEDAAAPAPAIAVAPAVSASPVSFSVVSCYSPPDLRILNSSLTI